MSLVNDLLEDFHRRRISLDENPKHPLAGVEIASHSSLPNEGLHRGSESGSRIGWLPWLFGVAGLSVLGLELVTAIAPRIADFGAIPAVAARPPLSSPLAGEAAETADEEAGTSAIRLAANAVTPETAELFDVEVQNSDGYSRVRFLLTEEREYWLEGDPAHGEIEVVITSTRLANAFSPYSFDGSGLQLQEAHNTSTGLHLLLSFEPAARVQSQFIDDGRGPALVLDVISAQARNETGGPEGAALEQQRDASPTEAFATTPATPRAGGWGGIQQTYRQEKNRVPESLRSLDRARALEAGNRKPEAVAEYIRTLALDPELHDAREALVVLLVEAGKYDAAQRHLADGLERAPRHSEYNLLNAQVLVAMKQPDRAIAILESLPTPARRRSDALNLLAALYQQKGDHPRAETLFRDAVQLSPHEARLWMGLGISLEGQQRATEALAVYKQAESLADFETGPRRWLRSRIRELSTVE